jgi:hypothetical protein
MDATVEHLGDVVIDALRAAGYMPSTIGQYEKTIRCLEGFVADRGGVYTPALGARFAAMTTSPRTGRFSAQRRFDYRRLVTLFDGYLAIGRVDLSMRTRGGGGPRPISDAFTALDAARPATCAPIRSTCAAAISTSSGAKGNRSRRLPITDQVTDVLAACDRASRDRFPWRGTFFVSGRGSPVTAATVGVAFNRIWDQAGLPRPTDGSQPRPYDLRHHFAYANLERWMAAGADVPALLPYLSRYMGHAGFESTYYYVHTSPDFMRGYADLTADAGASLLPEVGFE